MKIVVEDVIILFKRRFESESGGQQEPQIEQTYSNNS